jgi:23S rRNA (guanine2445-N2)-methyltransferase / 23S rRNA (guanine2069-N7)-methyltransferase
MSLLFNLFAPAARNCSDIAADEAVSAGGTVLSVLPGGVVFQGNHETIYRFCLYSRAASSLILTIGTFPIEDSDGLYRAAASIPWSDYFSVKASISIDATGKRDRAVEHTGYAARVVKDAVADHFRSRTGARPSVENTQPDVSISLFLEQKAATLGIDLAGEALHKRGYRKASGEAVLRETVAAAALVRAGWRDIAARGGSLFDPFCGSGTLLIEGALEAGAIAPGLYRQRFGFEMWKGHDPELWKRIRDEAAGHRKKALINLPKIFGSDSSSEAVEISRRNILAAGLEGKIEVTLSDARFAAPPPGCTPGLMIADPPYGKRSSLQGGSLQKLYRSFGESLKLHFGGWQAAVITGDEAREYRIGLKPEKLNTLYNGPVECSLAIYAIKERETEEPLSPGAEMAANRMRKNMKQLRKWLRAEGVTCYRLYDADMPEYSAAVDIYESSDNLLWVHLQEYAPPASIDPKAAARRLAELVDAVSAATGVPVDRISVKQRSRQKGKEQYRKMGEKHHQIEVFENGLRFLVNLHDYLDTGLFLDHRPVRLRIMESAKGKRFLNLFAYTGTATVHAAAGGAVRTLTVDNSNTYLAWAQENMGLNGFIAAFEESSESRGRRRTTAGGSPHLLVKADCLRWLEEHSKRRPGEFDLIFLDPPTFSNSKDMAETFDIQRDHPVLINRCMELLAPGGELIFSTNRHNFSLELPEVSPQWEIQDITRETIDPDYGNRKPPHRCWSIRKSGGGET